MKPGRTFFQILTVAAVFFLTGGMVRAITLDEALERIETHRFGQDNEALDFLHEAAVGSHSDPALRRKLNDGLIRILGSDAAYDAKQFVCRQLALAATEEHIPVLARHLGDEKMTHMALYVLTHIDSPQVDKALLLALEKATGNARLGIVNMLGNRRCSDAIEPLGKLLTSADEETSIGAIRALGRIGTESAHSQFGFYDIISDPPRKHSYAKTIALAYANLDFADRFLADGNTIQARRRYQFAFDKQHPAHIRAAGLKGLVATMGEQAGPFVAQALKSNNKQLYGMAATIVRTVPEKKTAETMAADLPDFEPAVQVLLINALAARSDGAGVAIVKTACKNPDVLVKRAALDAMGNIGDKSCISLLIEHAASGTEQDIALNSLANMAGENVNAVLIKRLRDSDNAEKAAICRALLGRNAAEAAPALIDAARTAEPLVRGEALKALHNLAGRREIPALVDLIFVVEPTEADQVGKVLAAVARRNSMHRDGTDNILSRYDGAANTDQRVALLLTLGGLGHERALPILRKGLQDDSSQIRYAAIKALSAWPNAAPADDLLEVARSTANQTHRVLALRGFIDLIDAAALPAAQKLAHYQQAMQLARKDAERKKVLSVLASLGTLDAFQMAASQIDNPSLENEAALAACRIAQQIYTSKGRQLIDDLERIAEAEVGDSTKQQAREILRSINDVKSFITDWQVSGPYMQKGKNHIALFDVRFAPEIDGGSGAQWRKLVPSAVEGMPAGTDPAWPWYLDLLKALDGGEQRVAYLRTRLQWPAEQRVTLRIGSDDGVKVWVNGQLVHANNVTRSFTPDQDSATVTLKKGENIILMKVTQNNMPWGACLRIEQPSPAAARNLAPTQLHTTGYTFIIDVMTDKVGQVLKDRA
ncbi:MAG: HEAT repeat domain-containing protein [Phycisphaerae bacterium]|nr:HEAT repeat domain-containing protein [Phycisphaerae bacterium]